MSTDGDPFLNAVDGFGYGGSKHICWEWHPDRKRVYTWGGDYGRGAGKFGQPDMGENFTVDGRTYERQASLNNDQYSIDPYAMGTTKWRIEHPYIPRVDASGAREVRPARPDQASLVWDPRRGKFWGIYTALRTEFLYRMPDGTPDLAANGTMAVSPGPEPAGTWSFVPSDTGGAGTWKLESTARCVCRSTGGTVYEPGGVLATMSHDERIAYWQRDPVTDKIYAYGFGRIFIFNPATIAYEHRVFSPGGYDYFNPCSSQVAINGDWMYGVAFVRETGGARRSVMVRVRISALNALANGATVQSGDYDVYTLPFSLSPGAIWENNNDSSAKWQEHAGVLTIDDKVVIIASYDQLVDAGVTKMAIFSTSSLQFALADAAPESIAADSWVALPDSGEVMFGLNGSYASTRLWAYRVRA